MENNLDKLFKSKLGGQEPEFHPAAWDRMEGLLEMEDTGSLPNKKPNRSRIIYLSLLFLGFTISVIGFYSSESSSALGEGSILASNIKTNPVINKIESKTIERASLNSNTSNASASNSNNSTKSDSFNKKSDQSKVDKNNGSLVEKTNLVISNAPEIDNLAYGARPLKEEENTNPFNKTTEEPNNSNNAKLNQTNVIVGESLTNMNTNAISKQNLGVQDLLENLSRKNTDLDNQSVSENSDDLKYLESNSKTEFVDLNVTNRQTTLESLNILDTKYGVLSAPDRQIMAETYFKKASLFEVGLQTSARFNEGRGYSIGPYLNYNIGKGVALNLGGQFDSQNFDQGPEMIVIDKVYSFGSKLIERKFSLNNQKSIRIPLSLRKSFYRFELSTGVVFNKIILTEGSISQGGEGGIEENVSIDNELIKPLTIGLQFGASMGITRYLDLEVGLEYRPKPFTSDPSIATNFNTYYPSLGLRYKLFKF